MKKKDKEELKTAILSVLALFGLLFVGAMMLMGVVLIGKGLGVITN